VEELPYRRYSGGRVTLQKLFWWKNYLTEVILVIMLDNYILYKTARRMEQILLKD